MVCVFCRFDSIGRDLFAVFYQHIAHTRHPEGSCTACPRLCKRTGTQHRFWEGETAGGWAAGLGRGSSGGRRGEPHRSVGCSIPSNCPAESRANRGRLPSGPFESVENSSGRFSQIKMANLLVALFQNRQNCQVSLPILNKKGRTTSHTSPWASQDPLSPPASKSRFCWQTINDSACQRLNEHNSS